MNPLVDHRTIYEAWRMGPAAVINLFEQAFGQYAVWEPPTTHQLQYSIERLREVRDHLLSQVARLEKDLAQQRYQNVVLSRKVGELETRLAKNSTNSSLPPSTDSPRVRKTKSLRQKSERKVGGQAAHQGTTREAGGAARSGGCSPSATVSGLRRVAGAESSHRL